MDAEERRDANEVGRKIVGCGDQGFVAAWGWLYGSAIVVICEIVVDLVEVHEDAGGRAHWPFVERGPGGSNRISGSCKRGLVRDSLACYRRGLLHDELDPIERPSATWLLGITSGDATGNDDDDKATEDVES